MFSLFFLIGYNILYIILYMSEDKNINYKDKYIKYKYKYIKQYGGNNSAIIKLFDIIDLIKSEIITKDLFNNIKSTIYKKIKSIIPSLDATSKINNLLNKINYLLINHYVDIKNDIDFWKTKTVNYIVDIMIINNNMTKDEIKDDQCYEIYNGSTKILKINGYTYSFIIKKNNKYSFNDSNKDIGVSNFYELDTPIFKINFKKDHILLEGGGKKTLNDLLEGGGKKTLNDLLDLLYELKKLFIDDEEIFKEITNFRNKHGGTLMIEDENTPLIFLHLNNIKKILLSVDQLSSDDIIIWRKTFSFLIEQTKLYYNITTLCPGYYYKFQKKIRYTNKKTHYDITYDGIIINTDGECAIRQGKDEKSINYYSEKTLVGSIKEVPLHYQCSFLKFSDIIQSVQEYHKIDKLDTNKEYSLNPYITINDITYISIYHKKDLVNNLDLYGLMQRYETEYLNEIEFYPKDTFLLDIRGEMLLTYDNIRRIPVELKPKFNDFRSLVEDVKLENGLSINRKINDDTIYTITPDLIIKNITYFFITKKKKTNKYCLL